MRSLRNKLGKSARWDHATCILFSFHHLFMKRRKPLEVLFGKFTLYSATILTLLILHIWGCISFVLHLHWQSFVIGHHFHNSSLYYIKSKVLRLFLSHWAELWRIIVDSHGLLNIATCRRSWCMVIYINGAAHIISRFTFKIPCCWLFFLFDLIILLLLLLVLFYKRLVSVSQCNFVKLGVGESLIGRRKISISWHLRRLWNLLLLILQA